MLFHQIMIRIQVFIIFIETSKNIILGLNKLKVKQIMLS
jgi:hypothetical protein